MQTERQRRLHDDNMSGNWSFGSNYQPCSQTRKMSIGLLVDSSQTKSKIGSGVAAELHTTENVKSAKDVPAASKRNGKEGMSSDLGRQNKAPRQESSPPIRRKTSDQNTAYPKVSSLPSTNNAPLQPSGNKIVDNMEAGSYFANQMLKLRAKDANEKKSKSNLNQREGGNHGTVGREEESGYVTPKKVPEPEKGTTEQGTSEKVNSGNILRMKVQGLLGTIVSSPNKTQHNSEPFEMDVDNLKQQSKTNENDALAAMDRQRLHTRETNSGSLNLKTRKPVTISASGKKPQAQKSVPKKQSPLCQSKQAHLDENAFSFVETWSKRSNTDVSPGFKAFKRKERDELETRPVKTYVVEEVHKDKSQKANDGRKTKAAATNTSLNVNRKRDSEVVKQNTEGVLKDKTQKATDGRKTKTATMNASLFENRKRDSEVVKQNTGGAIKDKAQKATDGRKTKTATMNASLFENRKRDSEVVKQNTEGAIKDKAQKATDGKKTKAAAISASLFENRKRDSEAVKPNTEMKEKARNYFDDLMTSCQPGGNNGTTSNNDVDQSPFAKRSFTSNVDPQSDLKSPTFEFKSTGISSPISSFESDMEDLDVDSPENSFKTKQFRSSHSKGFSKEGHYNANTENPSPNLPDSPPSPLITGGHKENSSGSPSEVMESQSSEDASPISVPIISKNLQGKKRPVSPCQEEDSESSEDDTPIKGVVDCYKFQDDSQQDGLVGAVKLFALALERVERKIHSSTSKQSAAILLSVSENIHSQLQNAESKIQNEVGKLTNLGKSKRMHPENQLQEQQEQLKGIYEKFKEEVDQHLEKCRRTLEGLEKHQVQVKGMVEKQKLSHKKFLMQTEEAIETQLNDAHKRIADVHKLAKEKMLILKKGIAECLKEGLLG